MAGGLDYMIFKGPFQLKPMGLLFYDTGWEAASAGLSYSGKNVRLL